MSTRDESAPGRHVPSSLNGQDSNQRPLAVTTIVERMESTHVEVNRIFHMSVQTCMGIRKIPNLISSPAQARRRSSLSRNSYF